jgi:hypothetical protein
MGVIKGLALVPLAPLRLTLWVSEKVAEETEREHYSQGAVVAQLREAEAAAQRGEISEQEARERQGRIIASRMQRASAGGEQESEGDGG